MYNSSSVGHSQPGKVGSLRPEMVLRPLKTPVVLYYCSCSTIFPLCLFFPSVTFLLNSFCTPSWLESLCVRINLQFVVRKTLYNPEGYGILYTIIDVVCYAVFYCWCPPCENHTVLKGQLKKERNLYYVPFFYFLNIWTTCVLNKTNK